MEQIQYAMIVLEWFYKMKNEKYKLNKKLQKKLDKLYAKLDRKSRT